MFKLRVLRVAFQVRPENHCVASKYITVVNDTGGVLGAHARRQRLGTAGQRPSGAFLLRHPPGELGCYFSGSCRKLGMLQATSLAHLHLCQLLLNCQIFIVSCLCIRLRTA